MTELPEIEILRNEADQWLTGKQVAKIKWVDSRVDPGLDSLVGYSVTRVFRRGKYILFEFDSGLTLVVHLMMVGQMLLSPPYSGNPKDVSLAIWFGDGSRLTVGQISFGFVAVVPSTALQDWQPLAKLGIDPLSPEFTPDYLAPLLLRRHAPIKSLLLDQKIFPGIGNTYADEILFTARIHPCRPGNALTRDEIAALCSAVCTEIRRGLSLDGSSEMDFLHLDGRPGRYQTEFQVKRREGKLCRVCSSVIQRVSVSGRGTYLCPACQG